MCYASVPHFLCSGESHIQRKPETSHFQINQPGFNGKLLRYGLPMSRLGSDFEGQQHSCGGALLEGVKMA